MSAQSGHGTIKAGIGNAHHAYIAIVVVFTVLYQPVDGIIGIAGFIYIIFCFFIGVELPAHFLFPVQVPNGLEPAPLTAKYFKINQKKKVSIDTNQLFASF
jgi:hypothetical protein